MNRSNVELTRGELSDFENAVRREWLVTNGIGGFASGTIGGARTRRYHGLLVAALKPPQERTLLVGGVDVNVRSDGIDYALATSEYHDGTVHPTGFRFIDRFRLLGTTPVWTYVLGDAVLEMSIWMDHGANSTYLRFEAIRASRPLQITLAPLCTYRDFHHHTRGASAPAVASHANGFELTAFDGAVPYRLTVDRGGYREAPAWYWGFRHRVESRRGLDDLEDLFRPGEFDATLEPGDTLTLTLSAEPQPRAPDEVIAEGRERTRALLNAMPPSAPAWLQRLALASDQFIVARHDANRAGRTIIAGYPWFGDWGRDTMIALPGLTLATRRFDVAAQILKTFARHVDRGMLPNRFPDAGDTPEYNTVDATLWYFHAIDRYLRYSGDRETAAELYPTLVEIIDWHERGTRYGIGVDSADGLLIAGEPGVQLTWMDAKIGDWVVTPRIGKPVEINALWYKALRTVGALATESGDDAAAQRFVRMAERVADAFQERYWNEAAGHLNDVIDGPDCRPDANGRLADPTLRPNQILALAVAPELVTQHVARAVVDVCARRLWTPVGLRSLAPNHPDYTPRYDGGPRERDGAYHQGTVWSWLLGPFALAHFNAFRDPAAARGWLGGVAGHLRDACVGQLSEIFDAEAPHAPEGCFAQAWSVAEILRAWLEISSAETACKETNT